MLWWKNSAGMAVSVSKFWKHSQHSKAWLRTWLWNYEWWWWYWHNLWISQLFLFTARRSSAFIQCERGITILQICKWNTKLLEVLCICVCQHNSRLFALSQTEKVKLQPWWVGILYISLSIIPNIVVSICSRYKWLLFCSNLK